MSAFSNISDSIYVIESVYYDQQGCLGRCPHFCQFQSLNDRADILSYCEDELLFTAGIFACVVWLFYTTLFSMRFVAVTERVCKSAELAAQSVLDLADDENIEKAPFYLPMDNEMNIQFWLSFRAVARQEIDLASRRISPILAVAVSLFFASVITIFLVVYAWEIPRTSLFVTIIAIPSFCTSIRILYALVHVNDLWHSSGECVRRAMWSIEIKSQACARNSVDDSAASCILNDAKRVKEFLTYVQEKLSAEREQGDVPFTLFTLRISNSMIYSLLGSAILAAVSIMWGLLSSNYETAK